MDFLRWILRRLLYSITFLAFLVLSIIGGALTVFYFYGRHLPDPEYLKNYEPTALSRIYAADGQILRVIAKEKRIHAPLSAIPPLVIQAFLSAEDKNFYYHFGIDITGMLRAVIINSLTRSWGTRPTGASTITQQVAKNFLVGNTRSLERKIKEAIVAMRLEASLSKERILELYLNEIYLGQGAYGVVVAAQTYFNKDLQELTIAEAAFIASLPKAPSFYMSESQLNRMKIRRDWVIERMLTDGWITEKAAQEAQAYPLVIHSPTIGVPESDFFAEEVRRAIPTLVSQEALERGGLTVRTSLDPELQAIASHALRQGLIAYDRRHGWRGPLHHVTMPKEVSREAWLQLLRSTPPIPGLGLWQIAIVLEITAEKAIIGLGDGKKGEIPLEALKWARKTGVRQQLGPPVVRPQDVLMIGDIVAVSRRSTHYDLEQIPVVSGGIVVMDPYTGRVQAMAGGFHFQISQFNIATQAERQPGSLMKPFVYLAALEQGYDPETPILDAPISIPLGKGLGMYTPQNIGRIYKGVCPMRDGLIHSRNVMTVRVAQNVGFKSISQIIRDFEIMKEVPRQYALVLGAHETTLLKMTNAYGIIANGGKKISPIMIEAIQDRRGHFLYQANGGGQAIQDPLKPDSGLFQDPVLYGKPLVSQKAIKQLQSMLQDVIQKGTGRRLLFLNRPIAGKTGSTNDYKDAWFIGFTPDKVVGVFVGFPQPRTLGEGETGARVAAPIFGFFMQEALRGKPVLPFPLANANHETYVGDQIQELEQEEILISQEID